MGDHPRFLIFLTKREIGPLGLPSGEGFLTSWSHAVGTTSTRFGLCASFLIHPPTTLEVRKRSGSSHELGETSAKVASGARLAVDPPVMAYIDQYLRFCMAVDGMPTMSDPHWVADFNRL
eukprot:4980254-Heterocapsa_arctica.AAC.1